MIIKGFEGDRPYEMELAEAISVDGDRFYQRLSDNYPSVDADNALAWLESLPMGELVQALQVLFDDVRLAVLS